MRVYFIKDFKQDGLALKAGSNATLWDATEALKESAVPWEQRHYYESQRAKAATTQSAGTDKKSPAKEIKKRKIKNGG